MSIRRMLSSIPSKPGVIIAMVVAVAALSIHYFYQYKNCTGLASLRSQLYVSVQQNANSVLRLADITPFEWERVRIIIEHKNKGKTLDCPFEWDWTQEQRKEMMSKGQLNIIAFARKGGVNTVVDFSSEMIDFELTETVFTPDSAVFHVEKHGPENTGYLLRQIK